MTNFFPNFIDKKKLKTRIASENYVDITDNN